MREKHVNKTHVMVHAFDPEDKEPKYQPQATPDRILKMNDTALSGICPSLMNSKWLWELWHHLCEPEGLSQSLRREPDLDAWNPKAPKCSADFYQSKSWSKLLRHDNDVDLEGDAAGFASVLEVSTGATLQYAQ